MSERTLWVAADTDVGLEREHNEDTYICQQDLGIFAVIDGVGGEVAGETAAKKAAEILLKRLNRRTAPAPQRLREAITLANNAIFDQAQRESQLRGMSCVLTAAVLEGRRLSVGHVGDTRLYLLRPGKIERITRDHSPVGQMEEQGELSEEEAMRHPRRSEIFRDVGSEPFTLESDDFVDLFELDFGPRDALLLCSDGLSDQVPQQEILECVELNKGVPQAAVDRLIQAANEAGGRDNVTVVLVEGEEYAQRVREFRGEPSSHRLSHPAASDSTPILGGGAVSDSAADSTSGSRSFVASSARSKLGRFFGAFVGRRARRLYFALFLVAAGAVLLQRFGDELPDWLQWFGFGREDQRPPLRVGGTDATHASIGEALAASRAGQVIEVAPGTYDERIELRDGVTLVSVIPRAAVLKPTAPGSLDEALVAVLAEGVRGARFEGFRIRGDDQGSLAVGLHLADSMVTVEDVEITGAGRAGIEIQGSDRSEIIYCVLRENGGAGVALSGPVATRLRHNLIQANGGGVEPLGAGIELRDGASPSLQDNRFSRNAAAAVRGLAPERVQEVAALNLFDGQSPEEAIIPVNESLREVPRAEGRSDSQEEEETAPRPQDFESQTPEGGLREW